MKILELTRSFYPSIGGMEKFVDDRLKIYQSLGHTYQLITTTHSEKKLDNSKQLDNVVYLPSYTPYGIVTGLAKTMEQDHDVLSINQTGYYYAMQAGKLASKKGKKIILTPHFYFHTNKHKLIKDFHYKFILPKILKVASRIVCFSEYEKEFWINHFSFIRDKLVVIPHHFTPPSRKGKISTTKFNNFFLFLGRGEKNKRTDLLIEAFHKMNTEHQLLLTLALDEVSVSIKEIVNKDNRIHLLGRIPEEEKQNLLASCSALVLPSEYEAFGIVNLEASYYKKPLLLSNLPVFKNIFTDDGVFYFKNNVDEISETLNKFIHLSPREKEKMGIANFNNLKRYDVEVITKKYSSLLEGL